jgi:hypothetical protein
MHPYRPPFVPEPGPGVAADNDGCRMAFRVMTFVGVVQVAIARLHEVARLTN